MIEIKDVSMIDGTITDLTIPSEQHHVIDANGLTLLPALIDPHVHFRTPGFEYKENWETAARACIAGGITTVFDMPNTNPSTTTQTALVEKKALIDSQLKQIEIPLRYRLYFGATRGHFDEIAKVKDDIIAIKVFMGSSTGDLLLEDDSSLHAIFALAKAHDLLVAVHAEDEQMIRERTKTMTSKHFIDHSHIRSPEVAAKATEKAIGLSKLYQTPLYILHVSTKEEIQLIKAAKESGALVFAETTPHHLFLTTEDYEKWGAKVQVNPPIRPPEHSKALLEAARSGIIDTIGSDHAPHTKQEKTQPFGKAPSGIPGVELTLPLLLNAFHEKELSLEHIVSLTHSRPREIFKLHENQDCVLVDLKKNKQVEDSLLKTKCGWSPYSGKALTGWPVYTLLKGQVYHVEAL